MNKNNINDNNTEVIITLIITTKTVIHIKNENTNNDKTKNTTNAKHNNTKILKRVVNKCNRQNDIKNK